MRCSNLQSKIFCTWMVLGLTASFAGCPASVEQEEKHSHDHHHHALPKTFAAALTEIETHRDAIQDAYAKESPEEAHGAMHAVAAVLEILPKLANKTELAEADREAVRQAADDLFDLFGQLDQGMHGGEKFDYADLADAIEKNYGILEAKQALLGEE